MKAEKANMTGLKSTRFFKKIVKELRTSMFKLVSQTSIKFVIFFSFSDEAAKDNMVLFMVGMDLILNLMVRLLCILKTEIYQHFFTDKIERTLKLKCMKMQSGQVHPSLL